MINVPTLARFAALAGIAFLTGCGGDDVRVYQVPRQAEPSSQDQPAVAAQDPGPAMPVLEWKLPDGWQEVPASEMRRASFRVKNDAGKIIDVSVIPLPGLAGTDLDNVNRWRGQVGQAALSEADLSKAGEQVPMDGQSANLYDQAGENPASGEKQRILAAILRRDGVAWFFKMMGEDDLVAKQKTAFVDFLKSVSFQANPGASPGTMSGGALPPSHPPIGGMAQAGLPPSHPPIGGISATTAPVTLASGAAQATAGSEKPQWTVPEGWQEIPGGQFLVAKFQITGPDNAQAAVNVSSSAGEGGGLAGNVNRWRKQIGLGELSADDVQKNVTALDAAGNRASIVDMSGTDPRTSQKVRVIGAIVPLQGQTWFYKLMGPEALVDREKPAFLKFLQSVKYAS